MNGDELKSLLDTMRQENAAGHAETRGLVERIDKKVDNSAADVDRRFDAVDARFAELRRHFDVSAEATKHDIQLVAESVAHVNEELKRETSALRQEMSRGFAETRR
jgi:hypothetical protein